MSLAIIASRCILNGLRPIICNVIGWSYVATYFNKIETYFNETVINGWISDRNSQPWYHRSYAGLNNSIGPIARNCPKWPSGNGIYVRSCPPNLCGWTFGQPIFSVPNYCSLPTNNDSVKEHLCRSCAWCHIQCLLFIIYLDHIIIIVLVPALKYWWRSSNSTTASQVVMKGDIITPCPSITSNMVIDKVHHYQISNASAMEIPQSCTWSCNEKGF